MSVGTGLRTGSHSATILSEGISAANGQACSRDQEAESDRPGIESMARAGYDPAAMPARPGR